MFGQALPGQTPKEWFTSGFMKKADTLRGLAEQCGIDPDGLAYLGRAQTANGTVPMARVRLDTVSLGETIERNVPASVNGGEMSGSRVERAGGGPPGGAPRPLRRPEGQGVTDGRPSPAALHRAAAERRGALLKAGG